MLCERGIRTFESYTRNTLDISAIPVVKKLSHLPIVVDPSHGTGRRDKVAPMARAAVAAGADGLLIEVHCDPDHALERWRAVDVPGAVRSSDGGTADHRARHRPDDLSRAGHAARLGRVNEPGNFPVRHLGIVGRRADRRFSGDGRSAGVAGRAGGRRGSRCRTRGGAAGHGIRCRRATPSACCAVPTSSSWPPPCSQNIALLPALAAVLDQPALITDTGSTKPATVSAAARLPDHLTFVGGHPLRRRGARRVGAGPRRSVRWTTLAHHTWVRHPIAGRCATARELRGRIGR